MSKLEVLNLSFLKQKDLACISPSSKSSYASAVENITFGVTAALVYVFLLWVAGRLILRARESPPADVTSFNRGTLSKVIMLLSLVYTPITSTVLPVFNCDVIGGQSVLHIDPSISCTSPSYATLYKEAILWTSVYVVGIPLFYIALMLFYHVPQVARELERDALLHALCDEVFRLKIDQPTGGAPFQSLTVSTITAEHVDILLRALTGKKTFEWHRFVAWRPAGLGGPALPNATAERLELLLAYSREHCRYDVVTWELAHGDPRMEGAQETIGSLYGLYYANRWYWSLCDTLFKLLISGVLGQISPGTQSQVVAGLGICFAYLLAVQVLQPHTQKPYRAIAACMAIELVVFLTLALMLKSGVHVVANDYKFYQTCLAINVCSVFVLPTILLFRRLFWWGLPDERKVNTAGAAWGSEMAAEAAEENKQRKMGWRSWGKGPRDTRPPALQWQRVWAAAGRQLDEASSPPSVAGPEARLRQFLSPSITSGREWATEEALHMKSGL